MRKFNIPFRRNILRTKKDITEAYRKILYSDNPLVENQGDFNFLMTVFRWHPEWDKKCAGQKITKILIGKDNWNKPCFYLQRADGTKTDISITKCLNHPTHYSEVVAACRTAVEPVITEFKFNFVKTHKGKIMHSELSGEIIHDMSELDVDHYDLEFKELVDLWIKQKGGVEALFQFVEETKDNNCTTRFTNDDLIADFVDFHNNHTHLRIVTRKENRSLRRKKNKH